MAGQHHDWDKIQATLSRLVPDAARSSLALKHHYNDLRKRARRANAAGAAEEGSTAEGTASATMNTVEGVAQVPGRSQPCQAPTSPAASTSQRASPQLEAADQVDFEDQAPDLGNVYDGYHAQPPTSGQSRPQASQPNSGPAEPSTAIMQGAIPPPATCSTIRPTAQPSQMREPDGVITRGPLENLLVHFDRSKGGARYDVISEDCIHIRYGSEEELLNGQVAPALFAVYQRPDTELVVMCAPQRIHPIADVVTVTSASEREEKHVKTTYTVLDSFTVRQYMATCIVSASAVQQCCKIVRGGYPVPNGIAPPCSRSSSTHPRRRRRHAPCTPRRARHFSRWAEAQRRSIVDRIARRARGQSEEQDGVDWQGEEAPDIEVLIELARQVYVGNGM